MNEQKVPAVVLGLGGMHPVGLVRSLGRENIPVNGFHVGRKRHPIAGESKYVQNSTIVDDKNQLLEELLTYGSSNDEKQVLFCTGDDYLLFCDNYRDQLETHFIVPSSPKGSLETLLDKVNNAELGAQAGFKVPFSKSLEDNIEYEGKILAKPVSSVGVGKDDIHIFNSRKDFNFARARLKEKYGNMAVQEYVPGGVEDHVEVQTTIVNGEPTIVGMLEKVHAVKNGTPGSLASVCKSVWYDELIKPSLELTRQLGYNGVLDINLKRHKETGEYYFLEVNLRSSGLLALTLESGLNGPALVYNEAMGKSNQDLLSDPFSLNKYLIAENRGKSIPMSFYGSLDVNDFQRNVYFAIKDPEDLGIYEEAMNVNFI